MIARDLDIISYLVHQMGGRAEIPLDWQRGEVTTTEGTDAEGRPVLIVTAKGGWLPGPSGIKEQG